MSLGWLEGINQTGTRPGRGSVAGGPRAPTLAHPQCRRNRVSWSGASGASAFIGKRHGGMEKKVQVALPLRGGAAAVCMEWGQRVHCERGGRESKAVHAAERTQHNVMRGVGGGASRMGGLVGVEGGQQALQRRGWGWAWRRERSAGDGTAWPGSRPAWGGATHMIRTDGEEVKKPAALARGRVWWRRKQGDGGERPGMEEA